MFEVIKPFLTISQRFRPGMFVLAEEVGSFIRAEELVRSGHLAKHEPKAEALPLKAEPEVQPVPPAAS